MLAFSRKQRLAPRPVDLNRLVIDLEDLLSRTLGDTVEVVTELADDLWSAMVDPHQFELVLLNLAINARDAMPVGGRLTIGTRNLPDGGGEPGLDRGDYVAVAVTDTGCGMTPDVTARACEPFFTTKEAGKGSGLGLAQAHGVLTQSGGGLDISSVPGRGSTITLYVPRSGEPAQWADDEVVGCSRHGDRRRVLVVDDHEDAREVIAAHLGVLGYTVAQAACARAAIELMQTEDNRVDLLVTDFAMPGMSGLELARAARAIRPGLPVVIVTGYVGTSEIEGDRTDATVLMKPFRMHELAAAIEQAAAPGPADAPLARVVDRDG
jgi:CheY-like chemotaxis protein